MPKRLLAMQSDATTMALFRNLLEEMNVELRVSPTPEFLIEQAMDWMPDLILLNCSVTIDSVLLLCGRIRSDAKLFDIPIIVASAEDNRAARLAVLEAGADDYFCNPFDLDEISIRLSNILRPQRYRRAMANRDVLRMITEKMPCGIAIANREQRVEFANVSAQMDFDLTRDDSQTWIEQLSDKYTLCEEADWVSLVNGVNVPTSLMMLEKAREGETGQGQMHWYKCMVFPMYEDPDQRSMICLVEVTKAMEANDILLDVKRLVSHKLRTPLNGLISPLELLSGGGCADDEERALLLSLAVSSAKRMEDAVTGLEDFFFSPRGPASSLHCNVADVAGMAELCAKEQFLPDPRISCKAPVGTVVPLGPNQLYNIFAELFENSVKFHPGHAPQVTVCIVQEGEIVHILVEDDGSHASPKALKHLHVPFYQSEELLTGEMQGHGLGLAQVARIIYSVGGRVSFYNRMDGPGLRVHLRLMATSPEGTKKVPIASIFANNKNVR